MYQQIRFNLLVIATLLPLLGMSCDDTDAPQRLSSENIKADIDITASDPSSSVYIIDVMLDNTTTGSPYWLEDDEKLLAKYDGVTYTLTEKTPFVYGNPPGWRYHHNIWLYDVAPGKVLLIEFIRGKSNEHIVSSIELPKVPTFYSPEFRATFTPTTQDIVVTWDKTLESDTVSLEYISYECDLPLTALLIDTPNNDGQYVIPAGSMFLDNCADLRYDQMPGAFGVEMFLTLERTGLISNMYAKGSEIKAYPIEAYTYFFISF